MDIQSIQNRYRIDKQTTEINSTKGTLKTCSPLEQDVFFNHLIRTLMANTKHNVITHGYGGTLGKQVVLRQRGEKNILATRPKRSGDDSKTLTPKQLAHRERFAKAIVYARKCMENPQVMERYAAVIRGNQNAFNVAMKDAMVPPLLSNLQTEAYTGAAGQPISVEAIDNFRVVSVEFKLISSDGTLLESGQATQDENGFGWIYTSQVSNPQIAGTTILVKAMDLPKNSSELVQAL